MVRAWPGLALASWATAAMLQDSSSSVLLQADVGKKEDCSYDGLYPRQYVCYETAELDPEKLDGDLSKLAWREVPWTEDFVDISTATRPHLRTRAKMRWGRGHLFVAAELEEPQVWGTLAKDDTVIFQDNDFEVFVDSNATNHYYKEFEINALNSRWSLMLNKPYGDGGAENSTRISKDRGWSMLPHSRTAVQVSPRGAINDPERPSASWSVEVALPLQDLAHNSARALPEHGTFWRIAFSRVEWHVEVNASSGEYVKKPSCQSCPEPGGPHEDNWVWTPQGEIAMHNPELWGLLQFATGAVNATKAARYDQWSSRSAAMAVYYAQKEYAKAHDGSYADSMEELLPFSKKPFALCASARTAVALERSGKGYSAVVTPPGSAWSASVTDDRLLTVASAAPQAA